jgi:AAA domain
LWGLQFNQEKNKWDKIPWGSSTDSATWNYLHVLKPRMSTADGIGFAFSYGYCGIDIDCCRDPKTGKITDWARAIIDRFNTYTELSVSGEGLHVLFHLTDDFSGSGVKRGGKEKGWEIAFYHSGRYFCTTGLPFEGHETIRDIDIDVVNDFYQELSSGRLDVTSPTNGHAKDNDDARETKGIGNNNAGGNKFERLMLGHWQELGYKSESEADFALCLMLAKFTGGSAAIIDRIFRTSALLDEKWDRHDGSYGTYGNRTIARAIQVVGKKLEQEGELLFRYPASVSAQDWQYVASPIESYDGWFRLGGVHLVGGSSGSGKSTLILDLLHKQAQGIEFLGHQTNKLRFLVLNADRPKKAVEETLERMDLVDCIPYAHLQNKMGAEAIIAILEAIEDFEVPQIVFIEGGDALVEDPLKSQVVGTFLSFLQKIAEHYAIAIILSVGAPKVKAGEGYVLTRDKVFGSQMWPRKSETIVFVTELAAEDGAREVDVQHRNAKCERFDMQFVGGRLVPRNPVSDAQASLERDILWQWVQRRGEYWWTRTDAVAAMKDADTGMSQATIYRRFELWLKQGLLETDSASSGKEHLRRKKQ